MYSNSFGEANNNYMPDYNKSKPSKYLYYVDCNNLYGKNMEEFLPYEGFEWVDLNIDVTSIPDNSPEGYILQVDLDYPNICTIYTKDFPLCPENRIPPGSKLQNC